jgi:hypothetical protein
VPSRTHERPIANFGRSKLPNHGIKGLEYVHSPQPDFVHYAKRMFGVFVLINAFAGTIVVFNMEVRLLTWMI